MKRDNYSSRKFYSAKKLNHRLELSSAKFDTDMFPVPGFSRVHGIRIKHKYKHSLKNKGEGNKWPTILNFHNV